MSGLFISGLGRALRGRLALACFASLLALAWAPSIVHAQTDPQSDPQDQVDTPQTDQDRPERKRPRRHRRPPPKPADKTKPTGGGPATTVQGVTVTSGSEHMRTSIDRLSYDISHDLQVQAGGSVADALSDVPGVDVDLNGKVSIRGDSGVTILVDGKPSSLFSGPGGAQALQTVPADEYERVEVMTNPTAEFAPDGSAGIINLVTKKTRRGGRKGVSGSMRTAVSADGRYNVGLNGAYHDGPLTFTGGVFVRHEVQRGESTDTREGFDTTGAPTFSTDTISRTHGERDSWAARGKLDYDIDDATRLTLGANLFGSKSSNHATSDITGADGSGVVDQVLDRTGHTETDLTHATVEGDLRHDFAGDEHNVTFSLQHSRTPFDSSQHFEDDNLTPALGGSFDEQITNSTTQLSDLKADYQRPMPMSGRFKAGAEVKIEDDLIDNQGFQGSLTPTAPSDPAETDLFHFNRQIDALYTTYEQPIGKLTILGGLRYETSRIKIDDITSNAVDHNDQWRLYPTVHLAWSFNDANQVVLSYSQRVSRPQPQQFDPFQVIRSPLNISEGNPDLKPQETQSYEASYRYRDGAANYIATLFYKDNTGAVTTVQDSLGNGVLLSTLENLDRSKSAGLELIAAKHLTPTLSFNVSGDASWDQIDARSLGFAQLRSGVSGRARGSVNWQMTPEDLFQIRVNYFGQRLAPQGFSEPRGRVNLGYRHKFNSHLSTLVTVQDAFDTFHNRSVIDTATLAEDSRQHAATRVVFFSLIYAFGYETRRDQDFDYGSDEGGGGGDR
ncbi:MAG TPA: outer membrane beta-barrel family protein [Caulobacteraceae bacterium]|nr:outer membrane beta-barrel family protein [Caulobacteraceae bacterium]